jgi:hypothetical protein
VPSTGGKAGTRQPCLNWAGWTSANRPVSRCRGSYQRPREKNPSSASTSTTMRMIQRMLMAVLFPLAEVRTPYAAAFFELVELLVTIGPRRSGGYCGPDRRAPSASSSGKPAAIASPAWRQSLTISSPKIAAACL